MKAFATSCPGCGGPVEFSVGGTRVVICEFCQSVVARTNVSVEDYGKVAELIETRSPLEIGLTGKFRGKNFEVIGRVQYQHPAGGVWDEWYLSLPGESIGWLAEAQGRFYMLFARSPKILDQRPDFNTLQVGDRFDLGKDLGVLTVHEKGIASARSAEGQIPWSFRPGAEHRFADLSGKNQQFGTFEFSTPPSAGADGSEPDLPQASPGGNEPGEKEPGGKDKKSGLNMFLGREVTLDDLHITARADENKGVVRTPATQVNCPQCAGPLKLFAPDVSERVTCPNCNSVLDCHHGQLKHLFVLNKQQRLHPQLPMGSTGRIDGIDWTLTGMLKRYVVYEGTRYFWTEYLLYEPRAGFRWLVNSDGHWNFVKPVTLGEIEFEGLYATYDKIPFRLYQKGTAHVAGVLGEFYWKVSIGEKADTRDYVAPPLMLSIESAGEGQGSEVVASLGRYVPHDELEQAFNIDTLPRPWSVSPNQPKYPVGHIVKPWIGFVILLWVIYLGSSAIFSTSPDGWLLWYALLGVSVIPIGAISLSLSLEHRRWANSDYSPYASQSDD